MSTPGISPSALEPGEPWPDSRRQWVALGGIVILALCARLFRLGFDSFWLDETASWWFASRPLAEQWGQVPFYEPHPPLYYTLLWLWSRLFGEDEAGLRSLSAFASVLTVPLIYGIGRLAAGRTSGHGIGLLAAGLAALHSIQIAYAQEARSYAVLILAVAVVLLALVWAVLHPQSLARPMSQILRDSTSGARWSVAAIVFGTALTFWLHNTALILVSPLLLVAALLIFRRVGWSSQLVRNFFVMGLCILLLWTPNVRWLISGMSEVTAGFWLQRPRWWDVIYVSDLLFGSMGISPTVPWKVGITGFVLGLCMLGAVALWWRGQRDAAILLGNAMVLPFLLTIAVSYVITPIFMPRVLIWLELPAFVLAASSVLLVPSTFLRTSLAAIACVFLAYVVVTGWARPEKEPWREVAAIVEAESGPEDLIVVDTAYAQVPMLYYRLPDRAAGTWLPLPAPYPLPIGKSGYPNGFFLRDTIDEATLERVRNTALASRSVWHVTRGRTVYDWNEQLARTFRETHGEGKARIMNGSAVLLTQYSARREGK